MALGGGMSCVKYLMFLFNLLFAITGLIIIIVGARAIITGSHYIDFTGERFYSLGPVILIIIGVIIFIVSFFGCFGAVKENRCMIITFATLLLIIFVAEMAVGIAGYVKHKDLETTLMKQLNLTMDRYNDPNIQRTFDIVQTDLKCCGVNGPEDWKKHNMSIPASCCSAQELGPGLDVIPCAENDANIHKDGCYQKLLELFQYIAAYLGGVGIGVAIVQLLGVIFACCLQRAIGSEYETV